MSDFNLSTVICLTVCVLNSNLNYDILLNGKLLFNCVAATLAGLNCKAFFLIGGLLNYLGYIVVTESRNIT